MRTPAETATTVPDFARHRMVTRWRPGTLWFKVAGVALTAIWVLFVLAYLMRSPVVSPASLCESAIALLCALGLLYLFHRDPALPTAFILVGTVVWIGSDVLRVVGLTLPGAATSVFWELAAWTDLMARTCWAASALVAVGRMGLVRTTRRTVETAMAASTVGFALFVVVHNSDQISAVGGALVPTLAADAGYLLLVMVAVYLTSPPLRLHYLLMAVPALLLAAADLLASSGLSVGVWLPAMLFAASNVVRVVGVALIVRLKSARDVQRPVAGANHVRPAGGRQGRRISILMPAVLLVLGAVIGLWPRSQWGTPAVATSVVLLVLILVREFLIGWEHHTHVTDLRGLTGKLERRARHDDLTGLLRRDQFLAVIAAAIEQGKLGGRPFAVLYIDLDHFKPINDTFGHAVGDQVLTGVANGLRRAVPGAAIGRLGGDEFGILHTGAVTETDVVALRQKIANALRTPILTETGVPIKVSGSVGAVLIDPLTTNGAAEAVLSRADRAALLSKSSRRPSRRASATRPDLLDIEQARHPIEQLQHGMVVPHFQPIVDLRDGSIVGAEAVARMMSAQPQARGSLPAPAPDFVPLLLAAGFATELTTAIVGPALKVLGRPPASAANWFVAVNLSTFDLTAPGIVGLVSDALNTAGTDPGRLMIEIDETTVSDVATSSVVAELRTIGVQIALTHFGAMVSTLGQLTQLRPSLIKLDPRMNPADAGGSSGILQRKLTAAVVEMAHDIGCRVVAEVIDTPSAADIMAELGCDLGQGSLWSPAVPAADLRKLGHRLNRAIDR